MSNKDEDIVPIVKHPKKTELNMTEHAALKGITSMTQKPEEGSALAHEIDTAKRAGREMNEIIAQAEQAKRERLTPSDVDEIFQGAESPTVASAPATPAQTQPAPPSTTPIVAPVKNNYKLTLNPAFENLNPDFSGLEHILSGASLQELSKQHKIESAQTRVRKINRQEGLLYLVWDLHGNYADWNFIKEEFLKELTKGTNAYLGLVGDINDGLFELDENFKPVRYPFGTKDGEELFKKGLAFKDDEHEQYVSLAYPDDSVKINAELLGLEHLLGGRILPLVGDHEWQFLFPGFPMDKSGINISDMVLSKLNDAEKEELRKTYAQRPLIITTPQWGISHTGPISSKNLKKIEEKYPEFKIRKDDPKYAEKIFAFIKNSAVGNATWGSIEEKDHPSAGKDTYRVYAEKRTRELLKALDVQKMLYGHSGVAPFIYEQNGKEVPAITGVTGFLDAGLQAIGATTEGVGCEHARSGEDRRGKNTYGKYAIIDLNHFDANNVQLYIGNMGEDAKPHFFPSFQRTIKTKTPKKQKTKTIIDVLEDGIKSAVMKGTFAQEHYDTFKTAKVTIGNDLKEGKITENIMNIALHYFNTLETQNQLPHLSKERQLKPLPSLIRPYFMRH